MHRAPENLSVVWEVRNQNKTGDDNEYKKRHACYYFGHRRRSHCFRNASGNLYRYLCGWRDVYCRLWHRSIVTIASIVGGKFRVFLTHHHSDHIYDLGLICWQVGGFWRVVWAWNWFMVQLSPTNSCIKWRICWIGCVGALNGGHRNSPCLVVKCYFGRGIEWRMKSVLALING